MRKSRWKQIFQRGSNLGPYVWALSFMLPLYFIFQSSSRLKITIGILMIVLFFAAYWLSFRTKGWQVYLWTAVQIVVSITMTLLFSFVYFSIFLAFFIGNLQNKAGFITLYTIHLSTTFLAVNVGFFTRDKMLFGQFPFVLLCMIVVLLLPLNTYNRNRQDHLEGKLEDANKRLSEMVKLEERQRIARDLHDTLGQKLSLIGLKSDLARKLVYKQPERARSEMEEVQQTARSALKEVRQIVTKMRGVLISEELAHTRKMLAAAGISLVEEGDSKLGQTTAFVENVLCMCLKEAVTNVVRHSGAANCSISIHSTATEVTLIVTDNGQGYEKGKELIIGNGIRGMKERIEFINGRFAMQCGEAGTSVEIVVPHIVKRNEAEEGTE